MASEPGKGDAAGLRLMVAEDEFHVLLLVEDLLDSLGCEVTERASNLAQAVACARTCDVDAALLDINLAGERIYPAAEILRARNIPMVFSTGYGAQGVESAWRDCTILQKPFLIRQLERALIEIKGRRASVAAMPSPPPAP
jgi:CheY-like chemotaxis protein